MINVAKIDLETEMFGTKVKEIITREIGATLTCNVRLQHLSASAQQPCMD